MIPRFYAPDADAEGQLVSLAAEEAEHFMRVLRGRAGDPVRVFDGRGRQFAATVRDASRLAVTVTLGATLPAAGEHRIRITLVPAVLKGDKMDGVVRDAVMMGVSRIQPIVSARAEVSLATLERGGRTARWNRIAVAAVKQSGRAVVPVVAAAVTFETLAATLDRDALMFVEPGEAGSGDTLADITVPTRDDVAVVVGPEGGWTPAEAARGRETCRLVTMKGPTLRADAMPVVALAALLARWGQL